MIADLEDLRDKIPLGRYGRPQAATAGLKRWLAEIEIR
jgi:hypothetical protein